METVGNRGFFNFKSRVSAISPRRHPALRRFTTLNASAVDIKVTVSGKVQHTNAEHRTLVPTLTQKSLILASVAFVECGKATVVFLRTSPSPMIGARIISDGSARRDGQQFID